MMQWALREAQAAAAKGEVPVGAVVTLGNQVVVACHNTKESVFDPTGHAEILALRRAALTLERWRLSGCTLYVTLEPCAMCAGALVHARVDRLVYGAPDPKAGAVRSLYKVCDVQRLNHRIDVVSGVLEEECRALLSGFFRERRAAKKRRV